MDTKMKAGRKKTGGRKKGTGNKVTKDLREMILESFNKTGGVSYLVQQSQENPKAYMALIAKVVPTEIKADINAIVQVSHKIVGVNK